MTPVESQLIAATVYHRNPEEARAIASELTERAFSDADGVEAWFHISELSESGMLSVIQFYNLMGKGRAAPMLKGATVNVETLRAWSEQIKADAYGRALRLHCYAVATDDNPMDAARQHSDLDDALSLVRGDFSTTTIDDIGEVVDQFDAFAADLRSRQQAERSLPIGIPELDPKCILTPSFGLILARTSHGKTATMCNMALGQAASGYHPVIITGEQPARQIIGRLLSIMLQCPFAATLGMQQATQATAEGLQGAKVWLRQSGLTILDGRRTVPNIAATAARLKERGRCDCLYVDQMSRVDHQQRKGENKEQAWTRSSNHFARLWQDIEAPVILLAQLNSKDAKDHPAPHPSHVKDCGSLLEDSDWQFLVDRPEADTRRFEALEKQRRKFVTSGDLQDADSFDARDKIWVSCTKDRVSLMGGEWKEALHWDKRCGAMGSGTSEEEV